MVRNVDYEARRRAVELEEEGLWEWMGGEAGSVASGDG